MPASPRYFLQENGQRTGPHSLDVLRQKAEVYVITPDTPIITEDDPEGWAPLRESQVLCSALFPERPNYTLAARTIDKVNALTEPHSAPSVHEMLRGNLARQRAVEGELLKPPPQRSNRRRLDYVFMVVFGNLFAALAWLLLPANPMVLVSLLGFVVIYNLGLAWVLFGVMDRY